jgi:hypothetical protein
MVAATHVYMATARHTHISRTCARRRRLAAHRRVLRITVTAREAIPSAPEIAATLRIAVHARLPLPSADAAQNRQMEGDARDERIIQ